MIDREHDLPVSRQAEVLNLARPTACYKPRPVSGEDLALMRRLDELRRAMGLPDGYRIEHGSRRDRIKLLGNGVAPPVMAAVVETLRRSS